MKVLQVIPNLGSGGAENFVVELTNELIRQGYDCDVLTLFDVDLKNNLRKKLNSDAKISSIGKRIGLDLKCYFKLYRFIKKGNYDIVHAHVGAIPYLLLSTLLLRKIKFVATIHSEARREAGKSIGKWNRFIMFQHGFCTPVTISEESKSSFDKYYKMNAKMVNNGVSDYVASEDVEIRDNANQLIFIHPASCQKVKNQELLFKAFSKLSSDYPNVKLLWLGSNKNFHDLYDSLMKFFPNCAQYIGVVPNVRDYLAKADAMCLSSKMEGMPMTIIEAFSVGCPPLCTPAGGIVNMIRDGENGLLSDDLEVESYYKMLKSFCDLSKEDRERMKKNAKKSFANYSIEVCAKNYLQIYQS